MPYKKKDEPDTKFDEVDEFKSILLTAEVDKPKLATTLIIAAVVLFSCTKKVEAGLAVEPA